MSTLKATNLQHKDSSDPNVVLYADGSTSIRNLQNFAPSLIENGAMTVAQRSNKTGVTDPSPGPCDRFRAVLNTLGTWSITRETDAPAGTGLKYSLKHTCTTADASPATADYAIIYQYIEKQNITPLLGYGATGAKNATLSFWVKSNKTGEASCGMFHDGTSGNRFRSHYYTINSADTWEYKTVTFNPDTVATKSALQDYQQGMTVEFWMNGGSNFQGPKQTDWHDGDSGRNAANLGVGGAVNDYLQITGVQLTATDAPIEFQHEDYSTTLAKCQRHLHVWVAWNNYARLAMGVAYTSTNVRAVYHFPVTMRVPPSAVNAIGPFLHWDTGSSQTLNSLSIDYSNQNSISLNSGSAFGGLTIGRAALIGANDDTSTYVEFISEMG